MSSLPLFLKAAGLGLAVAAPVGPMALLCMRRTLGRGWREGLATGLGIACGDGTYATVAALGLAGISAFLMAHQQPLHLAAGGVLILMGLSFLRRPAANTIATAAGGSLLRAWAGAYGLTLTNPPTILIFMALLAALAPPEGLAPPAAAVTVGGVMAGSLAWWTALVVVIALFGRALGPRVRRGIDILSGLALALYGALEIGRALL